MTEKRYAKNVWIILGISASLMLFFFILVGHHSDVRDRVQQQRGALLSGGSSADERIKPVGEVVVATAETKSDPAKPATAVAAAPARDGQQVYQASCAACHEAGIAGAPKVGDKAQWAKRAAKGTNALYASALNGSQSSAGAMPAKGGNPALSDVEVKAAVDYIVARSK